VTQFEFITVAISIVLALGVSRLLDVFGPALRPDQRSWIHFGWVVHKFFNHLLWWWSLWLLRETRWNLGLFMFEMVGPVVLYLQATALATPSERTRASWEDRFFEIRLPFFAGNLVLVLVILGASHAADIAQEAPLIPLALLGTLALAGLATRDARAHALIVAMALSIQVAGLGGAVFETQAP